MNTQQLFGLIAVAGVCTASALLGWYALRRGIVTAYEYYVAGGSLGGLVLSLSITGSILSLVIFFGVASLAYRTGLGTMAMVGAAGCTMAISWYLIHKKTLLVSKVKKWMSVGAVYEDRYGPGMRQFIAWVLTLVTLPWIAAQIQAVGSFFVGLNLPYWGGAVFVLAFIVFYMTLGGFRGTTYAHVAQTTVFLGIAALVFAVVVAKTGMEATGRQIASTMPNLFQVGAAGGRVWGFPMMITYGLAPTLGILCMPLTFQHTFATRSVSAFKIWTLSFGIVTLIVSFFSVMIGLTGVTVFPGLKGVQADAIYPMMVYKFFPSWLGSLLLGCVIGAGMSTIDALTVGNAMNLVNDWYCVNVNPQATDRQRIWYGRVTIIILIVISGLLVAVPVIPIAELFLLALAAAAQMIFALVGGYFWRRATKAAAIASILTGLAILYFLGLVWPGKLLNPVPQLGGLNAFLVALPVNGIVFLVVSLLTHQPEGIGKEFFHPAWEKP